MLGEGHEVDQDLRARVALVSSVVKLAGSLAG